MLKGSLVGIGHGKSILAPFLLISSLLASGALAAPPSGVEDGDLFVGAATGVIFGGFTGRGVFRVRGGVAEPFCMAPTVDGPEFFALPEEIIVDSAGRVVFLAALGPEGFAGTHIGLLRCNGIGVPPERLAILRTGAGALDAGWSVPFPNETFTRTSGLHLARLRSIQIDDLTSLPTVGTEDAYVFAVQTLASNGSVGETRTVRYRADTGEWDVGPEPPWGILPGYANPLPMPDMFFDGGSTYAAADGALRRTDDPLGLGVSGNIGGLDFTLQLSLFGGYRQIVGLIRDDVSLPNVVNCTGDNLTEPPSKAEPIEGGIPYGSMTGFHAGVLFDGYGDLGLVLRSNAGPAGHPYLTRVSQVLLNNDPNDDLGDWFYRSYAGCLPEASLKYTPILPFFDAVGAFNGVGSIAGSPQGLIGIQTDRIVRVVPQVGLTTLVSGLVSPRGLAAYPAAVAAGPGIVVIIRIDSPLDALLTDASGRRIGVDPRTGIAVTDSGTQGYVSPEGSEPRFIAVFGPQSGTWQLRRRGTGSGPYTIHVYGIDLDQPVGTHDKIAGLAAPGDMGDANFAVDVGGRAAFVDADGDAAADGIDNCIIMPNPDQGDSDGDGYGNACDADLNNDGVVNFGDLAAMKKVFFTTDAVADLNADGVVNFADLAIMKQSFFKKPGPAAGMP
jgi:hypothetical protein